MNRVLIVHPDADVRVSLERLLRTSGGRPFVVESASSLAEGLRRGRSVEPHIVFLDIESDRALVLHALGELRASQRLIVGLYNPLLTRGDLAAVREFTRAGMGDFIPTPVSEPEVLAAIRAHEQRQDAPASEGKVIAFFSQQGGVGTTTLAVNTALLMAGADQVRGPVVLCDAAVHFGSALTFLGLAAQRDLADYVSDPQGGAALAACLTDEAASGLRVLAAPRDPLAGDRITPDDMTRVLIELRRRFAWVVVDTPPSLDLLTLAVLDSADTVFVVTEAVTPTVLGTARLLKLLGDEQVAGDRLRVVLNRFNGFEGNLSERTVVEQIGRAIDHVVPYDKAFVTAATRGRPLIASRIAGAVERALSGIGEDAAGIDTRRPVRAAR